MRFAPIKTPAAGEPFRLAAPAPRISKIVQA
jgi:hypothetical protein